jgi:hypothetical protein
MFQNQRTVPLLGDIHAIVFLLETAQVDRAAALTGSDNSQLVVGSHCGCSTVDVAADRVL